MVGRRTTRQKSLETKGEEIINKNGLGPAMSQPVEPVNRSDSLAGSTGGSQASSTPSEVEFSGLVPKSADKPVEISPIELSTVPPKTVNAAATSVPAENQPSMEVDNESAERDNAEAKQKKKSKGKKKKKKAKDQDESATNVSNFSNLTT